MRIIAPAAPIVKNLTKASKDGDDHDIMMVYMLPKYGVPASAGAPVVKRTSKRRLDEVDSESGSAKKASSANAEPRPEDIRLGAHYEPALLPDYGGPYFNHVKSKLVQLDVRNINNDLIPPWKFYDALKPGTLVLALVSLHCFVMTDISGKERKERKIYQMNAHSIRVLADSDEPVETRLRPVAPNAADRATASLPGRLNSSFSSFTVPSSPAKDVDSEMVDDVVPGSKGKGKGKRSKTT
ncbi:hypothetical protein DFH06DRAFT_1348024 [Mycena polygramma]|nr:hypothetical protein DFH06DRAFT_1348024 [Mycena polygramma]